MSEDHTPSTGDDSDTWFGGRRWTGFAAIGMLVVVGLCVLIVVATRRDGGSSPDSGSAPAASSPTPTASAFSSSSPSQLPTAIPTSPPTGVSWSIQNKVALPTSTTAGPSHVSGVIATGYAHSPDGALLATANNLYRFALADDATWKKATNAMIAPGPGKSAWTKTRAAHPYGATGASASNFAQIVGFQFVSYTPTDAVIQIVTRDSDGNLQAGSDHVRWTSGDWKLVLTSTGGLEANTQTVTSLSGFTEWRGV